MKYEVTIGIPVYNVEKYIRRAMESVLAQTFPSIEFLICDDCGTDSSMDIVREYQRSHPRGEDIRILKQPQNMGIGNSRNRLIEEVRSKYLYFMDSDDVIVPNTIELLYKAAQKYEAEIVYGSHERINAIGNIITKSSCSYPAKQFFNKDEFACWAYRKYNGIQAMTWNILIDIDVYRKNGLRHQPVNFWEDYLFTMDLPTYVSRVALLPDITYYYYCREGSLSNYQKRNHIDKEEIMITARGLDKLKWQSDRIRNKSYFPRRMYKLMVTDFYVVCEILKNKDIISPVFTNQELHELMRTPLSFGDIIQFRQARLLNMILYVFWILPAPLSVAFMKLVAKIRKLI
mgnify:CR=1 FL=1